MSFPRYLRSKRPRNVCVARRNYGTQAMGTRHGLDLKTVHSQTKTTSELFLSYITMKACRYDFLVNSVPTILNTAAKLHLEKPVHWLVRQTVYKHFVAGSTLEECSAVVDKLAAANIKTTLDYSVEAADKVDEFVSVMMKTMEYTASKPLSMRFGVYKTTAIASKPLLQRMTDLLAYKEKYPDFELPWYSLAEADDWVHFVKTLPTASSPSGAPPQLTTAELDELSMILTRIEKIADHAQKLNVPVLIDAEQTYYQKAIHFFAKALMKRYNREKPIIYNTYQMYLRDSLDTLEKHIKECEKANIHFGAKLVRGAYIDGERERARALGYPDPIHPTIEATHASYDAAILKCMDVVEQKRGGLVIASHNENSVALGAEELNKRNLPCDYPYVHFAQLYGMSDSLSYSLAKHGYNICKYVPFGPVDAVLPYLVRRLQENKGIRERTSQEVEMLGKELRHRLLGL